MKHFSVIYRKDGSLVVTIFDANSMTVQLKMVAQIRLSRLLQHFQSILGVITCEA